MFNRNIFFKKYNLLWLFALCILFACKEDEPLISNIPEISFVSVTPTTVKEYQDSIVFTISYEDGDGDLGENNPDIVNLFLTDNRINITYPYRISQLTPDGSTIAIQGNLSIILMNTGIIDSALSQEAATYSIYLKDRAGHNSNTITSSVITIVE